MLFLFGGERGPVTFPAFKVLLSTLHVTAPGRSTAKIAFVYTAFRDSVHAAPALRRSSLGLQAKDGTLREEDLPLTGWPRNRIQGWRRSVWVSPWFRQSGDLLEPWLLLPFLFTSMWMLALLHTQSSLNIGIALIVGVILSAVLLAMSCIVLVWSQTKD
jgi:hypothetical protein